MRISAEFYIMRAEQCAAEAENAGLANVREQCLRAEAAWRAMADTLQNAARERQEFAASQALLDEEEI